MLDEEVVSAVAIGNLKAISEQPAMYSNLAYSNVVSSNNLGQQNSVSNQQAINELGISLVAKATNTVSNLQPVQARSAVDVLTNDEMAQTIADLKSSVQAFSGTGLGGKGFSKLIAKLKSLLEMGVEITSDGSIVIANGKMATVIFKGQYSNITATETISTDTATVKLEAK